jgi:Ca2+/H+ antiporter
MQAARMPWWRGPGPHWLVDPSGDLAFRHWPPAVAAVSSAVHQPITLGLDRKDQVLLALTLFISVITLGTGRTTVLQGVIHLAICAVFLFFAIVP